MENAGKGFDRRLTAIEVDTGYYTVYQEIQGTQYETAKLVVTVLNGNRVEHWFLYLSGATQSYAWPSSTNADQKMRLHYEGGSTNYQTIRSGLDAASIRYKYIVATCVEQN